MNVNKTKPEPSETPLHHYARDNNWQKMDDILRADGLNLNATTSEDAWSETPLHYAARFKNLQACVRLLFWGADQGCCNTFDETPLAVACKNDWAEGVMLFLSTRGENDYLEVGENPMGIAIKQENFDIFKLFIREYGIPEFMYYDETDRNGNLFHLVGKLKDTKILKFLLSIEPFVSFGYSPEDLLEARDCNGETPLMRAIYADRFQSACLLLKESEKYDVPLSISGGLIEEQIKNSIAHYDTEKSRMNGWNAHALPNRKGLKMMLSLVAKRRKSEALEIEGVPLDLVPEGVITND